MCLFNCYKITDYNELENNYQKFQSVQTSSTNSNPFSDDTLNIIFSFLNSKEQRSFLINKQIYNVYYKSLAGKKIEIASKMANDLNVIIKIKNIGHPSAPNPDIFVNLFLYQDKDNITVVPNHALEDKTDKLIAKLKINLVYDTKTVSRQWKVEFNSESSHWTERNSLQDALIFGGKVISSFISDTTNIASRRYAIPVGVKTTAELKTDDLTTQNLILGSSRQMENRVKSMIKLKGLQLNYFQTLFATEVL
jgi:hypothetical protein